MSNLTEDSDDQTSNNERTNVNSSEQMINSSNNDNRITFEQNENHSRREIIEETTQELLILNETVSDINIETSPTSNNATSENQPFTMSEQTIISNVDLSAETSTNRDASSTEHSTMTDRFTTETSQSIQNSSISLRNSRPIMRARMKQLKIELSPFKDKSPTVIDRLFERIARNRTVFNYEGQDVEIDVTKLNKSTEIIGSGQYGSVYLVNIEEPVNLTMAVKRIRMSNKPSDDQSIYAEITALEKIRDKPSPYIVDFYCALIDTAKAELCICMAYMTTTVEMFYRTMHQLDRVNNDDIDKFVRRCAHDSIMGLSHLADLGIVHRDIKPTNLLMNSHGQIKLADFGISGRLNSSEPDFDANVGTELYSRPGANKCSIENDMWSTGMSLIEMSNGEHPINERSFDPEPMPDESSADRERMLPSFEPSVLFKMAKFADSPAIPTRISFEVQNLLSKLLNINDKSETQSYKDIIAESFISKMTERPEGNELTLSEYVLERILPFGIPETRSEH